MATSSPSPTSPSASSPTSTVTLPPPPEPSTTPDPTTNTNANPPDSSTISPPPPEVTSPPPTSPPPPKSPPNSPPPAATSPPPATATATSPPPPTTNPPPPPPTTNPPPPSVDAPPPSSPTSPPPPTTTPPPTSPPPPSTPPPSSPTTITPPVPSPPSDPPSSSPPSPPITTPNSPPSTLSPPHSSPPPPASKSQSPTSQTPPPPVSRSTYPPPPPPSTLQSPKSSPSPPAQDSPSASPSKTSPSSPSSQISPTVSHLSPPPVSPSTLASLAPSSANPASGSSTASPLSKSGIVAISVVVGVVMLGLIGLVVFYMRKRKRRAFKHSGGYIMPSPCGSSQRSDSNLIVKTTPFSSAPLASSSGSGTLSPRSNGGLGQSRSWFTYQELYEATSGFALDNLLGEGGFGCVYKGVLANGREIAVKQLKIGGSQGEREFQAEVEIISRIHHRHLVSLVGYCMHESKRLLVYDYVPNQTLHYHLHGENRPVMDWATRIKIAVGSARGIAYLHEDCHPRIIHRDIKSSNILLDNRFEARVADFGLAKLALDVDTHVSTRVMGTFGYMAPEYATSGKLTDKSDVYSFGVVLLELLTGRKPVDASQPLGDESLVEWARPLLSHALETGQAEGLVDPRLEKNYVGSELFLMIEAAAACVRHSATKRPRMGQVVRAFDGLSPSDLSNGMRVGQSAIYDSAQQSEEIRWFRRMAFGSQDYTTDYFTEAVCNTGYSNPNQNNQAAVFSTQNNRNDPSQQQSQNMYFSSHINP